MPIIIDLLCMKISYKIKDLVKILFGINLYLCILNLISSVIVS